MSAARATLYYTPTSCGAASFIAATIGGVELDTKEVSIATHKILSTGADFYAVNPKGNVPALVLPGGALLNEGAAVLQWIADQATKGNLAPANGTTERYLLQNTLNYIATEIHAGGFGPLFGQLSPEAKAAQINKLNGKFAYIEKHMLAGGKKFLNGSNFTIADSYLYICLSWAPYVGVDLASANAAVAAYFNGIKELPEVKAAHAKMAELSAALPKQ